MIHNYKNLFAGLTTSELLILISFGVLYLIRIFYLFFFTGRILFRGNKKVDDGNNNPFSLIITVRNEEDNLKNNLPGILSITEVDFEVVVVDDYSQDNSYLVLGLMKERYNRLKISMLNQETRFSIKLAQNIAIKAAKNDWVLITPVSIAKVTPNWLKNMSTVFTNEKNIVLGYSNVLYDKGFFNQLYRIENFYSHAKSVGFILNRIPFVYSEENVAFRKKKYFEMGGYGKNITEPFANLELLINLFIQKTTTTILFNKETSIVKTETINRSDFFDLLKKNIRIEKHLSVAKRLVLAFEEFTQLVFFPVAIVVIILQFELWQIVVGLLAFKLIAYLFIIKITQNRLDERKIFISSLVYYLFMPYFKLLYRWSFNQRSKKQKWRSKI